MTVIEAVVDETVDIAFYITIIYYWSDWRYRQKVQAVLDGK